MTITNMETHIKNLQEALMRAMLWLRDGIRGFLQKAKNGIGTAVARIKLKRKRHQIRFISNFRKLRGWLLAKIDSIYRVFFLAILMIALGLLYWLGPHPIMSEKIAGQFFTTAGAMIGGAVAIIFTLSIFALQTASERYSASIFRAYANSTLERSIFYLLSLFAVALFVFGLFFSPLNEGELPSWSLDTGAYSGLLIIGLSFWLIQIFYSDVKKRVDPLAAIVMLRRDLKKQVASFQRDGKRLSEVALIPPGMDESVFGKMNLASTYQSLSQHNKHIDKSLDELFEITRKLIERNEVESAKLGLAVITEVLCDYIKVRGQASVILPAEIFLARTTDINDFLVKNLERFITLGERQILSGHELIAQYIVRQLVLLADCSKEILFVNPDPAKDNPALGMIMGYLTRFLKKAAEQKKLDVLLDGVRGMANIGAGIIQKAGDLQFSSWQDGMFELAAYGTLLEQDFLTKEAQNYWCALLRVLVRDKNWDAEHQLSKSLEKFAQLTLLHRQHIPQSGIAGRMSIIDVQSAPYRAVNDILVNLAIDYPTFDESERRRIRSIFSKLAEEFYGVLRALSEKIQCADDLFVHEVGKVTATMGEVLLNLAHETEWADQSDELRRWATWYVHLPYWFTAHAKELRKTNGFNELVDCAAKIGILASQLGDSAVAESSVDSIFSMTKSGLEKIRNGLGYDEPRILERACFVGIVALMNGQTNVMDSLKEAVTEFQLLYEKKHPVPKIPKTVFYSGPKKNQLLYELYGLLREAGDLNRYSLMDDAQNRLLSVAKKSDIEKFISEFLEPLIPDEPDNEILSEPPPDQSNTKSASVS
ncbi:MAG: hypothetical protein ABII13_00745 [Patescibacteria group bacterium]